MTHSKLFFALCLAGVMTFADFRTEGQGPLPVSIGFATPAGAVIGRPLTPLSYAGVARRTTRRAVAVGAAAGAAGAYGSSCVQVVDAYGRVTTRC